MKAKFPKYITLKNGKDLIFQKRIPSNILLKSNTNKKIFMRSMGISNGANDIEISKALTKSHELYKLHCLFLSNSSAEAISETELDIMATEYLRKLGKSAGSLVNSKNKGDDVNKLIQEDIYSIHQLKKAEAEGVHAGITLKEEVEYRVAKKLTEVMGYKPKTYQSLLNEYLKYKGWITDKRTKRSNKLTELQRNNNKTVKRINRFMAHLGDGIIAKDSASVIKLAIRNYCNDRTDKGKVTTATVHRELADIKGYLNFANNEYDYNWPTKTPALPPHTPKQKLPINQSEQLVLRDSIISSKELTSKRRMMSAICLLQLQGGMMPSEIKRLDLNQCKLDKDEGLTYVIITGDSKTKARKRIVPIVLGQELIREELANAIKWLNNTSTSSHSFAIKSFLQNITSNKNYTGHCLRHTFRVNCYTNNVSADFACSIGGWSGREMGLSEHLLNYGNAGIEDSDMVNSLYKASEQIHRHLL